MIKLLPSELFHRIVDDFYSAYQAAGLARLGAAYTQAMDDRLRQLAFVDAVDIEREITGSARRELRYDRERGEWVPSEELVF